MTHPGGHPEHGPGHALTSLCKYAWSLSKCGTIFVYQATFSTMVWGFLFLFCIFPASSTAETDDLDCCLVVWVVLVASLRSGRESIRLSRHPRLSRGWTYHLRHNITISACTRAPTSILHVPAQRWLLAVSDKHTGNMATDLLLCVIQKCNTRLLKSARLGCLSRSSVFATVLFHSRDKCPSCKSRSIEVSMTHEGSRGGFKAAYHSISSSP